MIKCIRPDRNNSNALCVMGSISNRAFLFEKNPKYTMHTLCHHNFNCTHDGPKRCEPKHRIYHVYLHMRKTLGCALFLLYDYYDYCLVSCASYYYHTIASSRQTKEGCCVHSFRPTVSRECSDSGPHTKGICIRRRKNERIRVENQPKNAYE